ncbi:DUF55-domain-containing protein [Massarina eburnea CBS 473.64]|uniref:Thymocyte nuclear protein 1 n=1 Tax=Massarina eburnea CBS 473.64 TaxID=1395130 RepID=A0A6A6RT37_9PLEO|nr:DUF55-domain-containing protein [Massarina eburnea CBS 473.64]
MSSQRRSARQSQTVAPKYEDKSSSHSEDEAPKRKAAKPTRRKRARENDDEVDVKKEDGSPPPKKVTKRSTKAAAKTAVKTESRIAKRVAAPPPDVSETNRDEKGEQEVYWLLKAEPLPRYENGVNVAFSIDDLRACTEPEPWGGVRNPQARNNMQAMRVGDLGFFYHSNAKPSGVVGVLRVVEEAKVDETAFDKKDPYYDPKSERGKPKWYCVGVEFVRKFDEVVDLHKIKSYAQQGGPLEGMQLITNGRLSVCKVRKNEWDFILKLAGEKEGDSAVTKEESSTEENK